MKKIILYTLILLCSCSKDSNNSTNIINKEDFPLKVGNWWKFIATDIVAPDDTLTLSVVSKQMHQDTSVYLCKLLNSSQRTIDSGYYYVNLDRIEYQGSNKFYSYFSNINIKFPFQKNSSWIGASNRDTVKVISYVDSVKQYNKTFESVFIIKRAYSTVGNYSYVQELYVKKGIGVIKNSFTEYSFGDITQKTFFLIDYKLN